MLSLLTVPGNVIYQYGSQHSSKIIPNMDSRTLRGPGFPRFSSASATIRIMEKYSGIRPAKNSAAFSLCAVKSSDVPTAAKLCPSVITPESAAASTQYRVCEKGRSSLSHAP